jgi:CAAX protease family protein
VVRPQHPDHHRDVGGVSAAWLRLRSGSLWPVVLAHASFNLYVQSGFNPLTVDTGVTEYIVDEFGFGFVVSGSVIAYIFWRLRHRLPPFPGSDIQPASAA